MVTPSYSDIGVIWRIPHILQVNVLNFGGVLLISGSLAEDRSRLVAFGTSSRTYDKVLVHTPFLPATSSRT